MIEFQPEPKRAIHCFSDTCGKSLIGYTNGSYHGFVYCLKCIENQWQEELFQHNRLMAADRETLGDETFVKLTMTDATVQPSVPRSNHPNKFYILSFMTKITDRTGSSGYGDTPELAWKQMADKIDKYLREPYR